MWDQKLPEWLQNSDTFVQHRLLSAEDTETVSFLLDNPPEGWANEIETLRDGQWLSDYVIDKYMGLIKKSCSKENTNLKVETVDCTVYNRLRTKGDFRKYQKRCKTAKEVAQSDLVLMPVHQGSHWALLAYFIRRKAVLLMDSLVANGHINRQTAMVRAKSFLTFFLQPEDLKWDEWSFSMPDDIPQQSNSDDCGVYACQFAHLLANGLPLNLPQACIPRLRQWMVLELSEDQEMMSDRIKVSSPGHFARGRQKERTLPCARHRSPAPMSENRFDQNTGKLSTSLDCSDEGYKSGTSSCDVLLDDSLSSAKPMSTSTPKKTLSELQETGKKTGKEREERFSQKAAMEAFYTNCGCGKDCCGKLGQGLIYECRQQFMQKNRDQQRAFIRNSLEHADRREESDRDKYEFSLKGYAICWKAWSLAFGVSKSRYFEERKAHEYNWAFTPDLRTGITYPSQRYLDAKVWLETTAKKVGDQMPDSTTVHLPHCLSKQEVYEMYKEDNMAGGLEPLGHSQFFVMWMKELQNIKIPKPSENFAKCTVCKLLKESVMKSRNKEEREKWKLARTEHLQRQKDERTKYYKHVKKARDNPEKYMSIILDGMDQKKTSIPHYTDKVKDDSPKPMGTHITGAISHGVSKIYAAIDIQNIPHDSNLTITVLMKVLQDEAQKRGGRLPPILYLQLDNSYRENKNCYVFAFCSELVRQKVVKKVKLGFLVVGHTHEDIDQFFSRISNTLKRTDATTLPELEDTISKSFTPTPHAFKVDHIMDYKSWFSEELENISGHSIPHCFKFTKHSTSAQPNIYFKEYSTNSEWKTTTGTTFQLLRQTPSQPLSFVEPFPLKHFAAVEEGITKARSMSRLTAEQHEWWKAFLTSLQEEYCPPDDVINPLSCFKEYVMPVEAEEEDEEREARRKALDSLIQRENRKAEVSIKRKRRMAAPVQAKKIRK